MYHSLYIHVPFCSGGKCDYCAFYSIGDSTPELREKYLNRLEEEFTEHASECAPLRSIFVGGGTPSALATEELSQLLGAVRRNFTLTPDCEWSMEANPDSLTMEKLHAALEGGVSRLSLGVQSFQPHLRERLGRRGSLETLPELVAQARKLGLPKLNFDLIYDIPGQTLPDWDSDLHAALSLSPEHLSCYSLIFEENTPLSRRLKPPVDDEFFLQCWHHNDDLLAAHGLPRYEISNFAAQENRCRHNWEIWHGQTYLGCGPAAVSFDGEDRPANPADLTAWLDHAPPTHDHLAPDARRREIFAFAFRTVVGWTWELLDKTLGLTQKDLANRPEIQSLIGQNWIILDNSGIRPTPRGLIFNDQLLEALL
ncbi:MAG: radical SAM family heme chaperone HemW [Victivallales bacterium]|nr:radical SAM family heme chaperone HemW [Victivallales bacterium]